MALIKCEECGAEISDKAIACVRCGAPIVAENVLNPLPRERAGPRGRVFAVVCAIIGGLVGYSLRPSVFLVGQLPFRVVITDGAELTGLDAVLKPAAERSFGMLVAGILIGAVAGLLIASITNSQR